MATTSYGVNDTLAVKLWAKELAHEAVKATEIYPLMGTDSNSVIQQKTETKKSAGDRITIGLRMQLSQDGFTENETAEGNGEALSTYSDNLLINELGGVVGVKSDNTIDAQRVPFDIRAEAKDGLVDWWARRISVSFFNQVCGNTATSGTGAPTSTKYTGLNTATAPTTGHRLTGGSSGTLEQALTSGQGITLGLIDSAVEVAKTGGSAGLPLIRPIQVDGGKHYVFYMHPAQVTQLRANTSSGQWLDIQKAAMAGMQASKSPIFTGALGMYNNVVLRESEQVCAGVNSTSSAALGSVRRAVFLGAQAAAMAFGMNSGENKFRWNEELYDHKRRLEVSAWSILGLKKLVWNSNDFGVITVSTFSPAAV